MRTPGQDKEPLGASSTKNQRDLPATTPICCVYMMMVRCSSDLSWLSHADAVPTTGGGTGTSKCRDCRRAIALAELCSLAGAGHASTSVLTAESKVAGAGRDERAHLSLTPLISLSPTPPHAGLAYSSVIYQMGY